MAAEDECVQWDYNAEHYANSVAICCAEFIEQIRKSPDSQAGALRDTRPFHKAIFRKAVPAACLYLAGEYRGAEYGCLRHREVALGARIGAPCCDVDRLMRDFHVSLRLSLLSLESSLCSSERTPEFLHDVIVFIAQVVSTFQDIHPYADGNGHVGRLLVWVITGHFGMTPAQWWLHKNPGTDWNQAVYAHQTGNPVPLQRFLMSTLF
jgi:hypothetical protein